MAEIILSRNEFLVLLNMMQVSSIVGIDTETLIPENPDEHRSKLEQGHQELQDRGLVRVQADGTLTMPELLVLIARVVTRPEIAIISRRESELGSQLFVHYVIDEFVVEQTFPAEGKHRLETLANLDALFERLLTIFPVTSSQTSQISISMHQDAFLEAEDAVEKGQMSKALSVFQTAGLKVTQTESLLQSLQQAQFSGNIALLRCQDETIIDARNPLIVQGPELAWTISQYPAGEPHLQITSVGRSEFNALLKQLFQELKSVPNTSQ